MLSWCRYCHTSYVRSPTLSVLHSSNELQIKVPNNEEYACWASFTWIFFSWRTIDVFWVKYLSIAFNIFIDNNRKGEYFILQGFQHYCKIYLCLMPWPRIWYQHKKFRFTNQIYPTEFESARKLLDHLMYTVKPLQKHGGSLVGVLVKDATAIREFMAKTQPLELNKLFEALKRFSVKPV